MGLKSMGFSITTTFINKPTFRGRFAQILLTLFEFISINLLFCSKILLFSKLSPPFLSCNTLKRRRPSINRLVKQIFSCSSFNFLDVFSEHSWVVWKPFTSKLLLKLDSKPTEHTTLKMHFLNRKIHASHF